MIGELALDAACREFKEHLYIAGKTSKDERFALQAAIEAYEAAKWRPTKWRPIQEAAMDGSFVLIFRPYRDHPSSDGGMLDLGFFSGADDAWMLAGRSRPRSLDQMVHEGAQFQTIDPPPQNAVSRVTQPTKNERG